MDEQAGSKKLSLGEVNSLLHPKKTKLPQVRVAAGSNIFTDAKKELLKLMDKEVKSIKIGGFDMVVGRRLGNDKIFVKPTRGFAPCGWFTRDYLKEKS